MRGSERPNADVDRPSADIALVPTAPLPVPDAKDFLSTSAPGRSMTGNIGTGSLYHSSETMRAQKDNHIVFFCDAGKTID